MDKSRHSQLALEWFALLESWPLHVRQTSRQLAADNDEQLATHFYTIMLDDRIASEFLTHEKVKTRLHASMKRWVVSIFGLDASTDLKPLVAEQIHIGMVHARVGVPVHVVLRGARSLKHKYSSLLDSNNQIDAATKLDMFNFISVSVDFAMEVMAGAYAESHDRSARVEESYRLFSMAQDVAGEKAQQRSALLNWENGVVYEKALSVETIRLPRIGASDFGLWFKHKGAHVFQGSYETDVILDAMSTIDDEILPELGSKVTPPNVIDPLQSMRDLQEKTRLIDAHLQRLFDQRNELEAGRDALTRLLSRRFLDVILAKEVSYARHSGTTFGLLALDIDHFKQVNDSYGHDSGDLVLQQLAELLNDHTRGGDYVFRLGGEEFLILLVDVERQGAVQVAEKLRQRIMNESFRLRNDILVHITVSIGVALHDGHPDHSRILRTADETLYQAKNSGRNSVVIA